MLLDLSRLHGSREHFERTFQPAAFDPQDEEYRVVTAVELSMDVVKAGGSAFRVTGRARTRLQLQCSRCLDDIEMPVEVGFELRYVPQTENKADEPDREIAEDDLTTAMERLDAERLDLHIHVVGDRGFRTALNAVERARANRSDAWRIQVTLAHDELIDPSDMPRAAGLGVILNWSPHWSGGMFGVAAAEHLGWERFNRMYQFNPVITSGGTVTYGSDVVTQYEANRADPFFGMQVGHTRVDPQYPMQPGPGTVEGTQIREPMSARLSLEDLLHGYTLNGAIQLRLADRIGSIEVGKSANLVVLDDDLFDLPADKIQNVEPVAVLFEGRLVHGTLQ